MILFKNTHKKRLFVIRISQFLTFYYIGFKIDLNNISYIPSRIMMASRIQNKINTWFIVKYRTLLVEMTVQKCWTVDSVGDRACLLSQVCTCLSVPTCRIPGDQSLSSKLYTSLLKCYPTHYVVFKEPPIARCLFSEHIRILSKS